MTMMSVLSYVRHLFLAAIGGPLLCFLLVLATSVPANLLGGESAEHILSLVFPLVVGWALPWYFVRRHPNRQAAWVWLLPTLYLITVIVSWKSYTPADVFVGSGGTIQIGGLSYNPTPGWYDAMLNLFTSNCGGTSCVYVMTVTWPFVASVAYSLAAATVIRRQAYANRVV